jgi:hypothetical protein
MSAHLVEVVVAGRLGPSLIAALDAYAVSTRDDGTTRIAGVVADQSELRGLLGLFDDLNIEVISVNRVSTV